MGSNTTTGASDPARPLLGWVAGTIAAMAGALCFWYLPLPWRLAGLPFAVAGTVVGAITCVRAWRNPAAGMLRLAAPVATLACGLFALPLAGQLAFYGPSLQYQQCQSDALTLRSQAACTREYIKQLQPSGLRILK